MKATATLPHKLNDLRAGYPIKIRVINPIYWIGIRKDDIVWINQMGRDAKDLTHLQSKGGIWARVINVHTEGKLYVIQVQAIREEP